MRVAKEYVDAYKRVQAQINDGTTDMVAPIKQYEITYLTEDQ